MGKSALPYEGGEARHHLSPCREIYSVVLVFAAHRRARMDAVRFEPDERKAVFQFAYVREEQTGRFVEHHGDDVVWASGVELSEVSRFVNEYLDSACHVSIKNGGNFPALGWTFTPAHGAVPPIWGTEDSLPNSRAWCKGSAKKFWQVVKMLPMWKCCQCGNVASSNVANGQWGGLAGKPFHERRQNWLVSRGRSPSRRGGRGATALPPCGRAMDGVTVGGAGSLLAAGSGRASRGGLPMIFTPPCASMALR